MDSITDVGYTYRKRGTKRRSFLILRFGVLSIAVLTLFVMVSFYKQLHEVSELFRQIRQSDIAAYSQYRTQSKRHMAAYNPGNNLHLNTDHKKLMDHEESFTNNEQNGTESGSTKPDITHAFQSRFQEKVYTVRRSFYESLRGPTGITDDPRESHARDRRIPRGGTRISRDDPRSLEDSTRISDVPRNPRIPRENPRNPRGNTNLSRDDHKSLQDPTGIPDPRGVPRGTRSNILILAYHRSGSSFLGEMFNRNPEVFYLFEPVHPIDVFLGAHRRFPLLYDTLVRQLLDTIFKCSFNKHPFFVNTLTTSSFRLKSQILSSPTLCDSRVTSTKMHLCQRINATLLTKLCRSRPHTVIKTIRVNNWDNLDFLADPSPLRDTPPSLKVIYLVRDPRAIIASRVSWFLRNLTRIWENNATDEKAAIKFAVMKHIRTMSAKLCGQMYSDINNWEKRTALGKPYAAIRYEDAAERPLDAYREIYEFAGLAQSEHVTKWLEENTKSDSNPDYYSTSRNSSAAAHKWRQTMPMILVAQVQKECSEVLSILGYRLVHSANDLKNTSLSLVNEWSKKGLLKTAEIINA